MPTVVLAPSIARWQTASPTPNAGSKSFVVAGVTVREALDAVFAATPGLRDYVLDERGAMRHHVVGFVNGVPVQDKATLSDSIPDDGELYLFQALSGG